MIAVDWGTTRLRAYLLNDSGEILDRVNRPEGGMQHVAAGAFPAALHDAIGSWLAAAPGERVIMAGMVGSRNGWAEAPYAFAPASVRDIASQMSAVTRQDGGLAMIVPGVLARDADGADVMRGEETLIFGCGTEDATIILPGTHSKWARLEGGRITGFATYMTGELYAWARNMSILSRLASEPGDESGFALGLRAARSSTGLTHLLFLARSNVLDGAMTGAQVGPYLSGLLIGAEILGAMASHSTSPERVLVADGHMAAAYQTALQFYGLNARLIAPEAALVAGLAALHAAM